MSGAEAVRLRDARDLDAGALGAILSEFLGGTEWLPNLHTEAENIGFCGRMIGRGWVRVAMLEGKPAGFIARNEAEVNALYVAGWAQRRGVGTALIADAKAARDQLTLWTFQANAPALAFYAREGFMEVTSSDGANNDEKLPDVRLTWERSPA